MILRKFECEHCDKVYDLKVDAQLCCASAITVQVCSLCEKVFYRKNEAEAHEAQDFCEVMDD